MIKTIRVLPEYNTYCIWLYDENDEIIDNDNPPEWNDDKELTDAFNDVSNLYDTFFVDNEKEFSYRGAPDTETSDRLKMMIKKAMKLLTEKNNGKYIIQNDISSDFTG